MQHKDHKESLDNMPEKMPFMMKARQWGKSPMPPHFTTLEFVKTAFPLFGGTEEEETATETSTETKASTESAASGGEPTLKEAEVPNLEAMTPEKIAELLKNVTDLSQQVTKLTAENNTFKSQEQKAERAKQTREQQLEQDLVESQQIIAKMDSVIRHTAVVNAIQGAKDMEFHSARHVMNELNSESFDLDVDLDTGTATVSGIEGELKRIAKECPWLVSKDKTQAPANQPQARQPRGSGTPPNNGSENGKQTKRTDLINRFPVIAHGRAG